MIALEPVEKVCAACRKTATYGTGIERRRPHVGDDDYFLDGCPGSEEWKLEALSELETCPHCGHEAPFDVRVIYPRLTPPPADALAGHSPLAQRFIRISHLFGIEDSREQGLWLRRAAWADDLAGLDAQAAKLRLHALPLLEDSVAQGFAASSVDGGTFLTLADMYRVAGDFESAKARIRTPLVMTERTRCRDLAVLEAHLILENSRERVTTGAAISEVAKLGPRRAEILRRIAKDVPWPKVLAKPWGSRLRYVPTTHGAHVDLPSIHAWYPEHAMTAPLHAEYGSGLAFLRILQDGGDVRRIVRERSQLVVLLAHTTTLSDERGARARAAIDAMDLLPYHGKLLADHPDAVDALERGCGASAPVVAKVKELVAAWEGAP